jgi:transposase
LLRRLEAARRGAVGRSQGAQRRLLAAAHRSPWAEIPERYGPSTTCYNRFVRWAKIGGRIFEAISRAYDGDLQMIDSSSIFGPKKRRPPLGTSLEPAAWGAREAD